VGGAAGAVAGLVAITPASGYVQPMEAIAIGLGAGCICFMAVRLRSRLGFDDSLDVVGVHGVGGVWGALATGIFATAAVSRTALGYDANGLLHGHAMQMWDQTVGVVVIGAYSFVMTFILLKVLDYIWGIRVSEDEEELGLDLTQHGERAYTGDDSGVPLLPGPILPAPSANYAAETSRWVTREVSR
jgi:Amt family ammonium transporter